MKENKIAGKIWGNIIIAVILMLYFITLNITYNKINLGEMIIVLKIAAMIIMTMAIIIFEIAYKKDNGIIAITGIEILVIALHTLSIMHIVEVSKFDFNIYILTSSYIYSIYFILKSIIIYTNEKRKYLKSLSDIKQIVANEPVKKEARRNNKSAD